MITQMKRDDTRQRSMLGRGEVDWAAAAMALVMIICFGGLLHWLFG
jgi:hypothetical protein